jgi:hypothetical protein
MYLERVEGIPFLFVSSFHLPTYLQRCVGHTYISNSDEGLADRAQLCFVEYTQNKNNSHI